MHYVQPNSNYCFVCGRQNPRGLYMKFFDDGENEVCSEYIVSEEYQGYPGVVHGGVIAAMLDEVVGRVAMIGDHHHFMMSVKLVVVLGFLLFMAIFYSHASTWFEIGSGFFKFGHVPVQRAEDANNNGVLDPGEDWDGDGNLDVVEPRLKKTRDTNGDGLI